MSGDFAAEPVMVREAPGWVRALTSCVVAMVAVIALIGSYGHMVEVGTEFGEGSLAYLTPLVVDGLAIASSMVLLVRKRSGRPAGFLARFTQVLALACSIAANIAAAEQAAGARLWALIPPVFLFLSYELLLQQVRVVKAEEAPRGAPERPQEGPARFPAPERRQVPESAPVKAYIEGGHAAAGEIPEHTGTPAETAPEPAAVDPQPVPARRPEPRPRTRSPRPAPKARARRQPKASRPTDEEVWRVACEVAREAGPDLGRPTLVRGLREREIPIGTNKAEQLLARIREEKVGQEGPVTP